MAVIVWMALAVMCVVVLGSFKSIDSMNPYVFLDFCGY